MPIELVKNFGNVNLKTPKILRLDETLTKEGYAADAAAVGAAIANMPTASPDWFASKGEEGYVDNRPMYPKYTNIPNKLNVETVEPNTAYCLLDGSSYTSIMAEMPSSFDNHSQCYLYFDYTIFGNTTPQKKHLDANTLKVLDSKNYFYKMGGNVVLYVVFDVSLLSEELKAQMPKTGVWVVNGAKSSITTIANVEFHEVTFIKLDKVYLPTDIAYKDYVDEAIANIELPEGSESSGEKWELISSGEITEDGISALEFTGLEKYNELTFAGAFIRNANGKNSGVKLYVNGYYIVSGGHYFIVYNQESCPTINIRKVAPNRIACYGNGAQLNTPYNINDYFKTQSPIPNNETEIRDIKIEITEANIYFTVGSTYELWGRV